MRFPDTPFMKRTFELAKRLDVELIPNIIHMEDPPNTRLFYNGNRAFNKPHSEGDDEDPFNVRNHLHEESLATHKGVDEKVRKLFQEFRDLFRPQSPGASPPCIETAMNELFKRTNNYTMRSFMLEKGVDSRDIHWCETIKIATGWYDRALAQGK